MDKKITRKERQREAFKKWSSKPEVRTRRAEYHKQRYIENRVKILKARKQYCARPEVKARSIEPEVRARHIEAAISS